MAFLKILLFVEREFGFWMPDEDLLRANIASARALASYICRRGKPA
jgi:acyl carrier protein